MQQQMRSLRPVVRLIASCSTNSLHLLTPKFSKSAFQFKVAKWRDPGGKHRRRRWCRLNIRHEGLRRNLSYLRPSTFPHTKQNHARGTVLSGSVMCHAIHRTSPTSLHADGASAANSQSPHVNRPRSKAGEGTGFRCTSKWVHS